MFKTGQKQAFKLLSLFVLAGLFLSSMGMSSLQTTFAQDSELSATVVGGVTYYIEVGVYEDDLVAASLEVGNTGKPGDGDDVSILSGGTLQLNFEYTEATFGDVPFDHPLHDYIQALWDSGYTAGCQADPLMYCPDTIMNRAQSAVFMLRGNFGAGYVPPVAPWDSFFDDWSVNPWAEKWAEGMWVEGMTAGCQADPLLYCPETQLPRVQAAVFGLRMKYGVAYVPDPASGTMFSDMTDTGYWGTKWAEQAYLDGLLLAGDCDDGSGLPEFCPDDLMDRAWGAFLVVMAKDLLPSP